jgi:hypothetical protein
MLKTASFSQTRDFTVLSRKKGTNFFSGLTWDVKHLKDSGAIEIIQYEEPMGISMNGQGIHFEAKLMVVKPKR